MTEKSSTSPSLPQPGSTQLKAFDDLVAKRKERKQLEILVVEDQTFSRQLLVGILGSSYKIYEADTANRAAELYIMHAPDIVFLDIELPDMNGHELAAWMGSLDAASFIVIVTGNNYMEDVERAKKNNVKSFIVKPYSKQKILDVLNDFSIKKYGV